MAFVKKNYRLLICLLCIVLAVVFFVIGISTKTITIEITDMDGAVVGEYSYEEKESDVAFRKAIGICMECIGIG